jgi:putative oxidoreductase
MKRLAVSALALAIVVEAAWLAVRIFRHHDGIGELWYALIMTVGFAALAATRGQVRWVATTIRILVGLAFASAIADRLGLMGAPGSPGVSWGTFPIFVTYTGQVNSFLPAAIIPALAVIETVIEAALGIAMLIGLQIRIAVWGSVALLCAFFTAMTISLGFASQLPYAVLVMAVGTWLLAASDASLLSVDKLIERRSPR